MKKIFWVFVGLVAALFFNVSAFAVDAIPPAGSNLFWNDILSNYTVSVFLIFAVLKLVAIINPAISNSSIIELLRRWIYGFPVVKRIPVSIFKDELKLIPVASSAAPAKKKSK